jgi:hypothetical protein
MKTEEGKISLPTVLFVCLIIFLVKACCSSSNHFKFSPSQNCIGLRRGWGVPEHSLGCSGSVAACIRKWGLSGKIFRNQKKWPSTLLNTNFSFRYSNNFLLNCFRLQHSTSGNWRKWIRNKSHIPALHFYYVIFVWSRQATNNFFRRFKNIYDCVKDREYKDIHSKSINGSNNLSASDCISNIQQLSITLWIMWLFCEIFY